MAVDEVRFRVMASEAQVIVVDGPPEACGTAQRALEQLEALWSRFIESSDIQRLNNSAGQPIQVDPATVTLIETMNEAWKQTDGLYDPTILRSLLSAGYVLSIDDPGAFTALPSVINHLHALAPSFSQLVIGANCCVSLPAPMAIDAGGIGKGLAADLVCAELIARGASGALVSIGGDLAAAGNGPEIDGWRIDIEDPLNRSITMSQMMVSGGGVATSSTQTRRWSKNGTDHHHTIDPATGQPSQTDLASVTVIAPCGWQAEAHATALLVGGTTEFAEYAAKNHLEAIGTTNAGSRLTTQAFTQILIAAGAKS